MRHRSPVDVGNANGYGAGVSRAVEPDAVIAAAGAVDSALRPFLDADWSVPAGNVEWSVEQTVVHLIGAPAKYTLYLASRSPRFIALNMAAWPDATYEELVASIVPVATGLAAVAGATPSEVRAFHADGPMAPGEFLAMACVELLVHCHDAVTGLGGRFSPPPDLVASVLQSAFPKVVVNVSPWRALVEATGRPPP